MENIYIYNEKKKKGSVCVRKCKKKKKNKIYELIVELFALAVIDISVAPVDVNTEKTDTSNIVPITSIDAVLYKE